MDNVYVWYFEYNIGDHDGLAAICGAGKEPESIKELITRKNPDIKIDGWTDSGLLIMAEIDWVETERRHFDLYSCPPDFSGIVIRRFLA